jgi:TetR/AcrR family transcriptional regulator, transcriptional repressor for nem operon
MESPGTAEQILNCAQTLIQLQGYNAFSYRDIASALGIKTASIHYHFPTKAHLGKSLMVRYRDHFRAELSRLDAEEPDPKAKLKSYLHLFQRTLDDSGKLCLCGMLAADALSLPAEVTDQVRLFFIDNEAWLTRTITEGKRSGKFRSEGSAQSIATAVISTLEGAMLVARGLSDPSRFSSTTSLLLKWLAP